MAANVVVVRDNKQWDMIQELLGELADGGIIITPDAAKELDQRLGTEWESDMDGIIEYDFGGEPDVVIDIARSINSSGAEAVIESLKGTDDDG